MNSVNNLLLNPFNLRTVEVKLTIKKLGRSTPDLCFTQTVQRGNISFNRKLIKNSEK